MKQFPSDHKSNWNWVSSYKVLDDKELYKNASDYTEFIFGENGGDINYRIYDTKSNEVTKKLISKEVVKLDNNMWFFMEQLNIFKEFYNSLQTKK